MWMETDTHTHTNAYPHARTHAHMPETYAHSSPCTHNLLARDIVVHASMMQVPYLIAPPHPMIKVPCTPHSVPAAPPYSLSTPCPLTPCPPHTHAHTLTGGSGAVTSGGSQAATTPAPAGGVASGSPALPAAAAAAAAAARRAAETAAPAAVAAHPAAAAAAGGLAQALEAKVSWRTAVGHVLLTELHPTI